MIALAEECYFGSYCPSAKGYSLLVCDLPPFIRGFITKDECSLC